MKKAMLLVDYDKGKPLTARRILAVKEAVTPFIEYFNGKLAAAKAGAAVIYNKVNDGDEDREPGAEIVTKEQVDGLIETAMKSVGTDRDALDVFAGTGLLDGMLVRGDGKLYPPPTSRVRRRRFSRTSPSAERPAHRGSRPRCIPKTRGSSPRSTR